MSKEIVFVGMDLGAFKTSITSSNGAREVVYTAVGWPRDQVARNLLGRDVVFGAEIVEHRLALNVVRPFQKGLLKYLGHVEAGVPEAEVERHREAARLIVSHAMSLANPPAGAAIYGVIGAPARASTANKQYLVEAARGAFNAVAVVSEPFAVAYGMNSLTDTLVVDIGAGTVDLCPMCGAYPADEDQLTLPVGGDYIDEEFLDRLQQVYPDVQLNAKMAREIKEKYGFVHNVADKVMVALPVNGKMKELNITTPLKEACQKMARPVVTGIQTLIARYDPEYQERLLKNILLCGGGSQLRGFDLYLEEGLKEYGRVRVHRAPDCVFAGAFGALKLARSMRKEYWDEMRSRDTPRETMRAAA